MHGKFEPRRRGGKPWVVPSVIVGFLAIVVSVAVVARPAIGADGIRLLSTGDHPRRVLRFNVTEGLEQSVDLTMRLKMYGKAGNLTLPVQSVSQGMNMAFNVIQVAPNGDMTVEVEISGGDDMMPQTGTMTANNRGVVKRVVFPPPEGVEPMAAQMMQQMEQSLKQASPPLPSEAVGVGAEWEHHASIEVMGLKVEQVSTMKVLSIQGTRVRLKIEVEQDVDTGDFEFPGMPAGADISLESFESSGTGEMEIDLESVVPVRAKIDMTLKVAISASFAGQDQEVEACFDLGMDIS